MFGSPPDSTRRQEASVVAEQRKGPRCGETVALRAVSKQAKPFKDFQNSNSSSLIQKDDILAPV